MRSPPGSDGVAAILDVPRRAPKVRESFRRGDPLGIAVTESSDGAATMAPTLDLLDSRVATGMAAAEPARRRVRVGPSEHLSPEMDTSPTRRSRSKNAAIALGSRPSPSRADASGGASETGAASPGDGT